MPDRRSATLHQPALGFRVWVRRPRAAMPVAHTHPDIELNFLPGSRIVYRHGGTHHTVVPGRLAVFWGGVPHQTLEAGGRSGIWITLPLAWFLQWRLPGRLADRLLAGDLIQADIAPEQVEQWLGDYESTNASRRQALLLELEAWFRRLAARAPVRSKPTRPAAGGASQIERITACIAARYQEQLTVADLAREVKLHPKYLMRVFKRHCGIGVWEYVTRLRISHAQRLLVATDARVTDLALESGFGSPAAFYQAFAAYARGEKPLDYRHRHAGLPRA
ncbi:MAG: helix-turn-helix domain-containing protein [Lacunisphaera sp.]